MDDVDKRMLKLHIAILQFIDQTGLASKIHSTTMTNMKVKEPSKVFDIPIEINVGKILESNGLLAEMILECPIETNLVFRNIIFVFLSFFNVFSPSMDESAISFCISKILSNAELKSLPSESITKYFNDIILKFKSEVGGFIADKVSPEALSTDSLTQQLCSSYVNTDQHCKIDFELISHAELDFNGNMPSKQHIIVSLSQVLVRFEIEGLPYAPPWKLTSIVDCPLDLEAPRIFLVSGIVMSLSSPTPYTVWVQYRCVSKKCATSPNGALTSASYEDQSLKTCGFCFSDLEEDPSSRVVGEKFVIILLSHKEYEHEEFYLKHPLTLIVKDGDFKCIEPGQRIEASVLAVPQSRKRRPNLEVVKIYPSITFRPSSHLSPLLRKFLDDRKSSPWSFVLTLAYSFCSTVSPPRTFHRLKMALLLSLASCSLDECGLAVLAVGKNEEVHSRLFKYASRCAPRAVYHSPLNTLCPNVDRDADGVTWIEAGTFLRARGGIAIIGDLASMKKEIKNVVFEVLESRYVRVAVPSRLRGSTNTLSYPLRAAVWSSYNPSYSRRREKLNEQIDPFLHMSVGQLTKSMTDVFGLVIYCDSLSPNVEEDRLDIKISLQILLDTIERDHKPTSLLPNKDIVQFLQLIQGVKLTFTPEAEHLLKGYYVVSRRLRGDCVQGAALPVTAINTLTEVSKCHARLSLRTKVEVWDVAAAILLCEEALASCSGFSPLQVVPTPHLPTDTDLHNILGRKNDEKMFAFMKTLENLISEHYIS